jgi:phosphoglycolate phosphatase
MNGSAPFEGAVAVLESLHQEGYILSVATGKSRRGLDHDLSAFGLTSLFTITRCGDECFSKPHPQMILDILRLTDVPPDKALMIGDTQRDLLMAQAANIDSLGVSYGLETRENLLQLNPRACIDDIIELPSWLKNQ